MLRALLLKAPDSFNAFTDRYVELQRRMPYRKQVFLGVLRKPIFLQIFCLENAWKYKVPLQ